MGFLERIKGVVSNTKTNKQIGVKKPYFGAGFSSNALKRTYLPTDTYQQAAVVQAQALTPQVYGVATPIIVSDDKLALEEPIKFIEKYCTSEVLNNAIRINPAIRQILAENKLPLTYNLENLNSLKTAHLAPCAKVAQNIYVNMGHKKDSQDFVYLTQAALLHDIGKAFIPAEILNKRGILTPSERKIIELHNRLSYEVLKTTGLNPKVAQLAYEHHNYDGKLVKTHANQALTIADVYCALREKRPYKKPISDLGAKAILYDMGVNNKLDTRFINCIKV